MVRWVGMTKSSSRYRDLGRVLSKGWLDFVVTDLTVKLVRYYSDKKRRLSCLKRMGPFIYISFGMGSECQDC
jgi:hypothetical protein